MRRKVWIHDTGTPILLIQRIIFEPGDCPLFIGTVRTQTLHIEAVGKVWMLYTDSGRMVADEIIRGDPGSYIGWDLQTLVQPHPECRMIHVARLLRDAWRQEPL